MSSCSSDASNFYQENMLVDLFSLFLKTASEDYLLQQMECMILRDNFHVAKEMNNNGDKLSTCDLMQISKDNKNFASKSKFKINSLMYSPKDI